MTLSLAKARERYVAMPKAARAALLFTGCSILQKGIAFLLTPIYTRIMSAEAYGQYSVFLTWYQLLMIFTTLNMWNYLMNNGMTDYGDDRRNFISALQGLSTVLTVAWFIVYWPCADLWEDATGLSKAAMLLMFAELLFMPSFEYYCAAKRFDYEARPVVVLSIVISVITPLLSIPLILMSDDKGMAAIAGKVIGSTLIFAGVAIYLIRGSRKFFSKEYWAYALRFNLPLIPHFLSMMVLGQSDRIMIERMCGQADAGMYSVAYQSGMALQVFNSGVLNAYVPYTYRAIKGDSLSQLRRSSLVLLFFIGVVNLMAVLVAPEIMLILAPSNYQQAVYAIQPVAMSNLFMFLFNLFANIEYYWGQTRQVALASIIAAVANIALNYFFISEFGFLAAGFTTLACYMLLSVCHYFFMRRAERKFMDGTRVYNIIAMIGISAGFTVASFVVLFAYSMLWIRVLLFATALCLFIAKRKKAMAFIKGMRSA